ncbi:hypothetical protein PINS_up013024 [Pythium insidiosum]|nr:hypothetical protein PINS_up013024 [Pythium insidiosum]
MKLHLPANLIPTVALSTDQRRTLIREAQTLLEDTLRAEASLGRYVPAAQYKRVRSKEQFHVYKQRQPSPASASASATATASSTRRRPRRRPEPSSSASSAATASPSSTSTTDDERARVDLYYFSDDDCDTDDLQRAEVATVDSDDLEGLVASLKPPHVPMLVASGTVEGSIEDSVYGSFVGDEISWRTRAAYTKDRFAAAKLLATLQRPTRSDPFRFLGVKWFTKELPAWVGSFVQRRDFVVLEGTGLTTDAAGRRVAYYLVHSVELPSVPELRDLGVIRGSVSLCFLSRQESSAVVRVFARGFSDPKGGLVERVATALTAESIVAALNVSECAHLKKLTWLMTQRRRQRLERWLCRPQYSDDDDDYDVDDDNDKANASADACRSCGKSPSRFPLAWGTSLLGCQVCGHSVCTKCAVKKQVVVDIAGDVAVERALSFCLGCVVEARDLSAWDVAMDTLVGPADAIRHSEDVRNVAPRSRSRAKSRCSKPRSSSSAATARQSTRVSTTPAVFVFGVTLH